MSNVIIHITTPVKVHHIGSQSQYLQRQVRDTPCFSLSLWHRLIRDKDSVEMNSFSGVVCPEGMFPVKGKMRHRVTLSTQSESAAFRRISLISSSGDWWCGVVHDGVNCGTATCMLCLWRKKSVSYLCSCAPDLLSYNSPRGLHPIGKFLSLIQHRG
jgi:hypothetical protein